MDFTGSLIIRPEKPIEELVNKVSKLLSINFMKDTSGKFDEFPAFIGTVFGVEIAVLGIPDKEHRDKVDPVTDYSMLVQSVVESPDDEIEIDLSVHLHSILQSGGIECSVGNA